MSLSLSLQCQYHSRQFKDTICTDKTLSIAIAWFGNQEHISAINAGTVCSHRLYYLKNDYPLLSKPSGNGLFAIAKSFKSQQLNNLRAMRSIQYNHNTINL